MEQRGGRPLRALRSVVGRLAPNGRYPQRLAPHSGPPGRGLLLDLMDQLEGALLPNLQGEVLPTGKRREVQRLGRRVPEAVELLASPACRVLLGPVEPGAREGCSLDQGAGGVPSRPVSWGRATRPSLQPLESTYPRRSIWAASSGLTTIAWYRRDQILSSQP